MLRHARISTRTQNKYHVKHYGPPSEFGFKDVIHTWKAENFDAEKLIALYKKVGAQYFFVMANHHDNFDMYDSKYQPWNSVNVGPHKDIVGDFAKAAHEQGLRFGVSVHAAHAWSFYEIAQSADQTGPLAGVSYDGKLTKADGKDKWWDGLDPQDLYVQNHTPSLNFSNANSIHGQWNWGNGASIPDQAYCDKFYNRTIDLVHKYKPDLIYFDDDALPLWPVSDAGLKIAADFYNFNMKQHNGKLEAVLFGKMLSESQQKCIVRDIERGAANQIEPFPWFKDEFAWIKAERLEGLIVVGLEPALDDFVAHIIQSIFWQGPGLEPFHRLHNINDFEVEDLHHVDDTGQSLGLGETVAADRRGSTCVAREARVPAFPGFSDDARRFAQ